MGWTGSGLRVKHIELGFESVCFVFVLFVCVCGGGGGGGGGVGGGGVIRV